MRVLIWPPGGLLPDGSSNDGCTEYRLLMVIRPLIAQGADIVVDTTGPVILWDREWRGLPEPPASVRAVALAQRPDADIIVLQRPARRWWADIIPMLQKLGIRVVVDMDDLLDRIDKRHVAYSEFDPKKVPHHNHTWVALACERADMVTVTTPALLERYGYGHGVVLPNLVPERYLKIDAEVKFATMGWTGNVQTHPNDLQATAGAVARTVNETGWGFHVIGTGNGVQEALGLFSEPTNTGYVPFVEYAERLGELSLGIVPLADTAFNRAKSCLKMIELASVGVPTVASATPDNVRMNKLGVGAIVKHPGQWSRTLHRLVKDRDYREHVAGRSREVMRGHTYEYQCGRWWTAWTGEK